MGVEKSVKDEQREKKKLLDRLLEKYDDGQKDVFFCFAVNMLEVDDLKEVLKQAEKTAVDIADLDKAEFMERQLRECAEKRNIVPQLRITDEPWFK